MQKNTYKALLCATLSAAVLTISACADKGSATTEDDPTVDAQTEIEQEATGVDDVEQITEGVNSANTSADPAVNDSMPKDSDADMAADDGVIVEGVDDSEILDGRESEEHVSTY